MIKVIKSKKCINSMNLHECHKQDSRGNLFSVVDVSKNNKCVYFLNYISIT
jgi:hypothetical protein